MPLYEYECDACGKHFELIRRFSDPEVDVCTLCGKGPVRRLMSSPAIQFKGSGWYITDYARKAKSETTKSEKSATGEKGEKGGDGKSDKSDSASGDKKSESGAKTDGASTSTSAASSETKP